MQERSRISELVGELKSAIHRHIVGINVASLDLLPDANITSVEPRMRSSSRRIPYALDCRTHWFEHIAIDANIFDFPAMRPSVRHLQSLTAPHVACMPIVGCANGTVNTVSFDLNQNPPVEVKFSAEINLGEISESVKISIPKVISPLEGISEKSVNLREVEVCGRPRTRRDLHVISRQPITIRPAPWGELEKRFIIKCWELLRERVKEQLGHDPGKDLEMTAIFRDIDFFNIRRTVYDRNSRELKLFLHESVSRNQSRQSSYAIIIGLVKGTGKVVQVSMPE